MVTIDGFVSRARERYQAATFPTLHPLPLHASHISNQSFYLQIPSLSVPLSRPRQSPLVWRGCTSQLSRSPGFPSGGSQHHPCSRALGGSWHCSRIHHLLRENPKAPTAATASPAARRPRPAQSQPEIQPGFPHNSFAPQTVPKDTPLHHYFPANNKLTRFYWNLIVKFYCPPRFQRFPPTWSRGSVGTGGRLAGSPPR